jgi:hypothetical protein
LRNSFTNSTPMFYRQPCKQWCGLSIQTNVYHDTTEPLGNRFRHLSGLKWCLRLFLIYRKKYWNYALRKCFQRNTRQWIYAILTVLDIRQATLLYLTRFVVETHTKKICWSGKSNIRIHALHN